jgi:hypothetical protein
MKPVIGEIVGQLTQNPNIPSITERLKTQEIGSDPIDYRIAEFVNALKKHNGKSHFKQWPQNSGANSHKSTGS